jgi:gas vesicle protein
VNNLLSGILTGALLGAALAMVLAPTENKPNQRDA